MAFLDTGIAELNDLLTRRRDSGIAVPGQDGVASSTIILRGTAGAGKSILAAVLAANLHQTRLPAGGRVFVTYYSFAQPATGVDRYLREILDRKPAGRSSGSTTDDFQPHPLIVSPKSTRCLSGTDGLAVLRQTLVETLNPLQLPKLGSHVTERDVAQALKKLYTYFDQSPDWLVNAAWHQVAAHELQAAEATNEKYDTDAGRTPGKESAETGQEAAYVLPVVIVDPINTYFDYRDARSTVAELFAAFRQLQWPLIATLEDPGANADPYYRQLVSFTEFEADVVVCLSVGGNNYVRRTISVQKNRNSQPVYGDQLYRIENAGHSLANLLTHDHPWKQRHPGYLIFKSVHWFLSRCRTRSSELRYYHSGITAIDQSLLAGQDPATGGAPLPCDSYVLVNGPKGGHKLSIAFNLLIAGLWDNGEVVHEANDTAANLGDVMLLSFGEETSIQVDRIALSGNGDTQLIDNGSRIDHFELAESTPSPGHDGVDYKVVINKWNWFRAGSQDDNSPPQGNQLIEVNFKPGYLAPDEFLWVIETLVAAHEPSRILVDNTAYFRMRFPELHAEPMLFPALSSLTRQKNIMLIVSDIVDERGGDPRLSHGLAACADYIVNLRPWDRSDEMEFLKPQLPCGRRKDGAPGSVVESTQAESGFDLDESITRAVMAISNVRGKNYVRPTYGVSVAPVDGRNVLLVAPLRRRS